MTGTTLQFKFTYEHYHALRRVNLMLDQVLQSSMSRSTAEAYLQLVSQDVKRVLAGCVRAEAG